MIKSLQYRGTRVENIELIIPARDVVTKAKGKYLIVCSNKTGMRIK